MQMKSEAAAQLTETLQGTISNSMKVFFGATSVSSIFLSGLFIYLMGMVNGMQIQSLTCLFKVRLPTNAMTIMVTILNLAAFDMF
jgi:hypothetical protein